MKKLFIALLVVLLSGYNVSATFAQEKATNTDIEETIKQWEKFQAVYGLIRQRYVEEKTDEELIDLALNGLLSSLDPHSDFLTEDEMEDLRESTEGNFGGLGIHITSEDGVVKVVSPIDDTPAAKAGVLAGDYITHLDGEAIIGIELNDAVDRMRGEPGTSIIITVRQGLRGEPRDLEIIRDIIEIDSVKSEKMDNIGYIRVATFNDKTKKELEKALLNLEGSDGYVLDLRNNPGGLLTMAIEVSQAFLDGGKIVSTKGRSDMDQSEFFADNGDRIHTKPLVVIINEGSASASEIVAGALQDHKRAIVVGTKSFGKGSVQTLYPLLYQDAAVKMTTSLYYTPLGTSIQAEGIVPDIEIKQEELVEKENDWEKYLIAEKDLQGALKNGNHKKEQKKSTKKKSKKDKDIVLEEDKPDYQLDRAVDLAKGMVIYHTSMTGK